MKRHPLSSLLFSGAAFLFVFVVPVVLGVPAFARAATFASNANDASNNWNSAATWGNALNAPTDAVIGPNGNLFVSDFRGGLIFEIATSSGSIVNRYDLSGGSDSFFDPTGLAFSPSGNLYVADTGNNRIVEIATSTNTVAASYTLAGGSDSFHGPSYIAFDASGNLYVSDVLHNRVVEVATTTNAVAASYTLAGSSSFNRPEGLTFDSRGNLYVMDLLNSRIVKVATSTNAVAAAYDLSGSNGLDLPYGVAFDAAGNLYVADTGDLRIIKVATSTNSMAASYTLSGGGGPFKSLYSITFDKAGKMYADDGKVDSPGRVVLVATSTDSVVTTYTGAASAEGVSYPGITDDATVLANGNLTLSGNQSVHNLTIKQGGVLDLNTHTLTVAGALLNNTLAFTTNYASSVSSTTATFNGSVSNFGGIYGVTYGFTWGTSVAYGATTTVGTISSQSPFSFSSTTVMVSRGTTYHYRAYVATPAGAVYGSDRVADIPTGKTFTATQSGVWNVGTTWGGACASSCVSGVDYPGSTDSAVVVNSTTVTLSQPQTVLDVTIQSGGTLNENQYALSVSSDLNNYGGTLLTGFSIPTVTTGSASSQTTSGATLGGSITDVGGANATVRGFAWGTDTTYGATTTETGSFATTTFSYSLSGLTCNTTYDYLAYATNPAGTGYGSNASFTTSGCPSSSGGGGGGGGYSVGGGGGGTMVNLINHPVTSTAACLPGAAFNTQTGAPCAASTTVAFAALITKNLYIGLTDPQVITLQHYLNLFGFAVAAIGPGSLNNEVARFGPATQAAVARLQTAEGIPATGYVGPRTLAFIASHPLASSTAVSTTSGAYTFTQNLGLGSFGPDVKNLQVFLNTHGFSIATAGNGSLGMESLYFGPATQNALARFQQANGITPATGYLGPKTRSFIANH